MFFFWMCDDILPFPNVAQFPVTIMWLTFFEGKYSNIAVFPHFVLFCECSANLGIFVRQTGLLYLFHTLPMLMNSYMQTLNLDLNLFQIIVYVYRYTYFRGNFLPLWPHSIEFTHFLTAHQPYDNSPSCWKFMHSFGVYRHYWKLCT